MEWVALLLFLAVIVLLLAGFPVAFSLGGTALIFAVFGILGGGFESAFLTGLPSRIFGIMTNEIMVAVPLFVFMGITLERARIAEDLLDTLSALFGSLRGGLGISVTLVGMLLAASTGIVGATVVTMGLLALPTMLKRGYSPEIAAGTICASGTLGQIIPPSIILVMLGDVMSTAYQQAQLAQGNFSPDTVSVGDLFAGALIPGLLLVVLYLLWLVFSAIVKPASMPAHVAGGDDRVSAGRIFNALAPPLILILAVLGSILAGLATPTEAAGVGAMGALLLAMRRRGLSIDRLQEIMRGTLRISSMVFMILIGASVFSLVFRGYGGDDGVRAVLDALPGGVISAVVVVMLVMFLLGFVLDFIEITFVVVPIVGPVLLGMGLDPVWLGVMIAINLQTSFLTPPFGFALFYLRGVAPPEITTGQIYRGVIPFVARQLADALIGFRDRLEGVERGLDARRPLVGGGQFFHGLAAQALQQFEHIVRQPADLDIRILFHLLQCDGVAPGVLRHDVVVDRLADIRDDFLDVGWQCIPRIEIDRALQHGARFMPARVVIITCRFVQTERQVIVGSYPFRGVNGAGLQRGENLRCRYRNLRCARPLHDLTTHAGNAHLQTFEVLN